MIEKNIKKIHTTTITSKQDIAKKNNFIDITEDSLEERKNTLIEELLKVEHRKLNQVQIDHLLKNWAETHYSPLYLKIAIEEVKHWKNRNDKDDNPILCEKQKLNKGIDGEDGIISEYLKNLTSYYHHEELLIKKVFGYIYSSKDGLSERELLQILSEDLEDDEKFREAIINKYHKAIKVSNPRRDAKEEHILPISIWSRLHTQIKPFLIERNIDGQPLMKFFHRQFTTVVEELYTEDEKEALHTKLADYFLTLQDKTKVWDKRYYNLHMLDELPYHLFHSKNSDQLKEILFDLEFAGCVYDNHKQDKFREILEKSIQLDGISHDEIYPWESFYREKEHLIVRVDEEQWRPHQSLFQLAYEDGDDSPLSINIDILLEDKKIDFFWLKQNTISKKYVRTGLLKVFEGHSRPILGIKVINDSHFLSYAEDYIINIWLKNGTKLVSLNTKILLDNDYIQNVEVVSSNIVIAYSELKLIVWNIYEPQYRIKVHNFHYSNYSKIILNNKFVSYSSAMESLFILDLNTNAFPKSLQIHNDEFVDVLDDGCIIIIYQKNILKVFNPISGISFDFTHPEEISKVKVWDNSKILTCSGNNLSLWEINSHLPPALFAGHQKPVYHCDFLENGKILSFSKDNTIRLWSQDGKEESIYYVKDGLVKEAEVLDDNSLFVVYCDQIFIVKPFEKNNHYCHKVNMHIDNIRFLNKEKVFLGSYHKIILFDISAKEEVVEFDNLHKYDRTHKDHIDNFIEILDQHRFVFYSGGNGKNIQIWNLDDNLINEFKGHTYPIQGVLKLDDNTLFSYASDGTSRIWNLNKKNSNIEGTVIASSKVDKKYVLTYSNDQKLTLFDLMGNQLGFINNINIDLHPVTGTLDLEKIQILANDNIVSFLDNIFKVNDICNNNEIIFEGHTEPVNGVVLLRNNDLVSYSDDYTLRLWNMKGREKSIFIGHENSIRNVIVIDDNTILSYSSHDIRIWDLDGTLLKVKTYEFSDIYQYIDEIQVLTEDTIVIKSIFDTSLKFLNIKSSEEKIVFTENKIDKIFHDCTNKLISISNDYKMQLWNSSGDREAIFVSHKDKINGVTFINENRLLSYSKDKTLRMWDMLGKEMVVFTGHKSNIWGVKNINEYYIISHAHDKTLRIWNMLGIQLGMFYLPFESFEVYNIEEKYLYIYNNINASLYSFHLGNQPIRLNKIAKKFKENKNQ